ncbi:MAG: SdpI family protein [Lachnospiraceae bacterium]|nr:SdpI family protein [Lachnospiraceae bacterium]
MKQQKWKYVLSSMMIALPVLIFWILVNTRTEEMKVTGGLTTGNMMVIVGIQTVLLLAVHLLCLYVTMKDRGNQNQSKKAIGMVFWIVPIISFFATGICMKAVFDLPYDLTFFVFVLLGLLFMLIGNYLPKCRRNFTLGIKVKWALCNDENWNMTHRFGGKVWVLAGLALLILAFIPEQVFFVTFLPVLLVMIFAPILYSYLYYRKQKAAGTYTEDADNPYKTTGKYVRVIVIVIVVAVALLLTTGSFKIQYNDSDFTVEAACWSDLTVRYDEIEDIEYLEQYRKGDREMGFGSFKLGMGLFHNQEFGDYTLYAYNKTSQGVRLTVNGETIVISAEDEAATKAIYEELSARVK